MSTTNASDFMSDFTSRKAKAPKTSTSGGAGKDGHGEHEIHMNKNDIESIRQRLPEGTEEYLKKEWYLDGQGFFEALEIKGYLFDLHESAVFKIVNENMLLSSKVASARRKLLQMSQSVAPTKKTRKKSDDIVGGNVKDGNFSDELVKELFAKNIVINYQSQSYSTLKSILTSTNMTEAVDENGKKHQILYFDEEIILGYIRLIHPTISDGDLEKVITAVFLPLFFDIINSQLAFAGPTTIIYNLNGVTGYVSKLFMRYFDASTNFTNNILQGVAASKKGKKENKDIHGVNFVFFADKDVEVEKEMLAFLKANDFQMYDFESKVLGEIIYNLVKKDIPEPIQRYFKMYQMKNWMIAKYAIKYMGDFSKETLTDFFLDEFMIDLNEGDMTKERKLEIKNNVIAKVKWQDYNIINFLQTFYGYLDTQKNEKPFVAFFAGSSGVGKTYFTKTLAQELGWNYIKKDMGNYSEAHSTSALLGSPPGYVGYDAKTIVDELKESHHNIILFDELEKAHPEILKAFYGILDDGIITDRKGDTAVLKGWHIIIFTSNIFESLTDVEKALQRYDNEQRGSNDSHAEEFNILNDLIYNKYADPTKLTAKDKKGILTGMDKISGLLKTAVTRSPSYPIPNAFANRISLFQMFQPITDRKIISVIAELEYQKAYNNASDAQREKYAKVWKKDKEHIIDLMLASDDIKQRGGREIYTFIRNTLGKEVSWGDVDLF